MRTEIPGGWEATNIRAATSPRSDRVDPASLSDIAYIGLEHVEAQSSRLIGSVAAQTMKSVCVRFQVGDVLYSRLRPYLNKVVQVPFAGVCSAEFIVLPETEALSGNFLRYRLNAREFVNFASHLNAGDRPRVDFDQIGDFKVLLPPIKEQLRISNKLDELFSDLDAGVASLQRARANLKRYRAAVLKSAVEGRLTADWRAQHPPTETGAELLARLLRERRLRWEETQLAKFEAAGRAPPLGWRGRYVEPVAPDTGKLPSLPNGWCCASLSQVGFVDRGKSKHRPRNAPHLYNGPYPFIQTGDVRASDTFVRDWTQSYSAAGLAQSRLWPTGTLCITIAANIAETGILDFEACFPDSVVGFLPGSDHVSVRYIELFFRTARERLEAYAPATAQKNINLDLLHQVAVPLPPSAEQVQIVELLDRIFSNTNRMNLDVGNAIGRAAALRQSILKRAFSGRLVPQDPNDEPASILLERIRQARAAESANPRKPARKPPASRPGSKSGVGTAARGRPRKPQV